METNSIQNKHIDEVIPYERNAKEHPKKQVEQIAESIREFGFNQPIVIDTKGVIIVGHGRYEAAKVLELEQVPTLTVNITEEQAKAYRLADNKLNESKWDMDSVVSELKELSLPMLDLTGFSRDLILDDYDKDDIIPDTPKTPKTKLGDVYMLGDKHFVICGDSTRQETYQKLMGDIKADMVFTDPPYNVNYSGRGKKTSRKIENDHMENQQFNTFLSGFFNNAVQYVKAGAGWYVFHASSSQHNFKEAIEESGMEIRAQLIWNKPTASMGWGDYRWKHEPFFYAGKRDTKLIFYGDRTHKTVVDFHKDEKKLVSWAKKEKRLESMGLSTIWTMKRDSVNDYEHPTQKPVELICYALANSSKGEDIVLDPFMGSGSTLIACEKSDRICYGVEFEPNFVDVIVQRYVDYTGNTKVKKNGVIEEWPISSKIKPVNTVQKIALFIFGILTASSVIIGSTYSVVGIHDEGIETRYLRGQSGEKCYIEGEQPKSINMDRALYFESYQECKDSL